MENHPDKPPASPTPAQLQELAALAVSLGASSAVVLPASQVQVEDRLAALCKETRCENYGLSPTCPPAVEGPAWLREYLRGIKHVLLIQLELPMDAMYSQQRREVGQLLHFIVIQVEHAAQELGLTKAMGLAGGSCKKLFCPEEAHCRVLHGDGECRNPDSARPSVSGFGINMNRLIKAAGWDQAGSDGEANQRYSSRFGLVLLG